jgi:glycosyltransferase involved in cell wall biosynthesis
VTAVQVQVELPENMDVAAHEQAHARDEVPDRTPYGLHHLEDDPDVHVRFRRSLQDERLQWVSKKVRDRLDGYEPVAEAVATLSPERRHADVVLCMDEHTGFPAALVPGGPPAVSNIVWAGRPEEYSRVQRAAVGRAIRRLSGVITQAAGADADLTEAWDLDPDRVHHIRLGIDTDFFPVQPWSDATMTVATVGDDVFRDHPLLVDAVARVRKRGLPARLELGTTRTDVDMPAELGVLHRRRMEGAVRAMYGRASVVAVALQPTRRGSGSTVVLEAAASGRPVVVSRVPAMAGLVEHGVRGLLVDPEDPDAMADGIAELLADPERAAAMGEAARRWVTEEHSTAVMAADIRAVLRSAVATP